MSHICRAIKFIKDGNCLSEKRINNIVFENSTMVCHIDLIYYTLIESVLMDYDSGLKFVNLLSDEFVVVAFPTYYC